MSLRVDEEQPAPPAAPRDGASAGAPDAGGRAAGFRAELAGAIEPLRQSLRQLFREIGSPATPRVMQHRLGVPYVACWQAFRVARAADATAEAQHAPSPGMLKGLLTASRAHGGTEQTVAAAAAAAAAFHAFVTRHAGDRSTFDAMVAETPTGRRSETLLLQRRRAAYRATSQIWGVQTDLQCMTSIVGPPAADGSPYNRVILMMQRGVRRLRADAPVTLVATHTRPFGDPDALPMLPLDAVAAEQYGMSILPAFSSPSLTDVRRVTTVSGWQSHDLAGSDVGRRSSFEFVLGGLLPGTPQETDAAGRGVYVSSFTISRRPVALLVIDVLLHRASLPHVKPRSIVYQNQEGDLTQATAECSPRFPGDEQVEFAGPADGVDLAEAPRYPDLLRYAVDGKGWDLAEFDAYRIRVPFPVVSTTARVYYTWPSGSGQVG